MTGVLPVAKPEGPTSHDMVASARRILRTRRVGHTGTLDPFASGLLLLCIGRATRLSEYLTGLEKTYEAVARLGASTDTLDREGRVVSTSDAWADLDEATVRSAFEDQQGTLLQTPPEYSAKKIGGRRAYELAREGVRVAPDPVEVSIHSLRVLSVDGPDVTFSVRCSSGTYIRAIGRDAGAALGTGAHLTKLRRTAVGGFHLDQAVRLEDLEDPTEAEAALIRPLDALGHLPVVELGADEVARVGHGQALQAEGRAPTGRVVLAADSRLLAVAESDGATLRPRKVFT